MSTFTQVDEWVATNLATNNDVTQIDKDTMLALQTMADNENESLANRAFNALRNYQGQDGMRALSSIITNSHNPKTDDYMANAFGIVILKADPHSTDGVFVILQLVPERYVLKTIIRVTKEYVVTTVTHTFFSVFESSLTKPFMLTGTHGGQCQLDLFEHKRKHDNGERIDPQLEAGNNNPFVIQKPNGETYEP